MTNMSPIKSEEFRPNFYLVTHTSQLANLPTQICDYYQAITAFALLHAKIPFRYGSGITVQSNVGKVFTPTFTIYIERLPIHLVISDQPRIAYCTNDKTAGGATGFPPYYLLDSRGNPIEQMYAGVPLSFFYDKIQDFINTLTPEAEPLFFKEAKEKLEDAKPHLKTYNGKVYSLYKESIRILRKVRNS